MLVHVLVIITLTTVQAGELKVKEVNSSLTRGLHHTNHSHGQHCKAFSIDGVNLCTQRGLMYRLILIAVSLHPRQSVPTQVLMMLLHCENRGPKNSLPTSV